MNQLCKNNTETFGCHVAAVSEIEIDRDGESSLQIDHSVNGIEASGARFRGIA